MSWFSTNYEKAALGGAVLVALGLAYMGWSKLGGVEEDFNLRLAGAGKNNPAVEGADLIPKAMQSMKLDHTWTQGVDGDRPVDLFTGIGLFIKSSEPDKAIDLIKGAEVHDGIPNTWWLENHIDPGFADSPQRDPDEDGFSNLDEFTAKTDPNNAKSHPALIAKLMYAKDESLAWVIRPGYGTENGGFSFSYEDNKGGKNRVSPGEEVMPGGLFFPKPPMKERFKLLGHEVRKEMNQAIHLEMETTYVRIEDQKSNKKGTVYEFPAPLNRDQRAKFQQYDRSAVLSLEALGLQGKEFKIEENTTFSLPPEAPRKDYLLKKVTPDSIIVEFPKADGSRDTVEIRKGGLPELPKQP